MNYKKMLKVNTMKRNFLMKAVVCLFTVVALCSCSKDDDEKKDEPKSTACEIVSFGVGNVAWNIDGANITHTYPPETPKTSLTPTITLSPGATVNPPATEAKNFFTEQGITYTVTAEDGQATKIYTVKATVQDDEEENNAIQNNTIIAVIEDGASFNEKIDSVKMEIYFESNDSKNEITLAKAAYANGKFSINLPENVDAQYLEIIEFEEEGIPQGLTVSNPNAKIGSISLNAYKSNSDIGYFYHGTEDWQGELVYSDSDVSVTGSHTETYDEGTYTYKDTYNVYLKEGWNMMYSKFTSKENNSYEYEYTTQVPAGAKWYFYDYYGSESVSGSLLKPKTLSAKRTFGFK
jgi:hypothetical protein